MNRIFTLVMCFCVSLITQAQSVEKPAFSENELFIGLTKDAAAQMITTDGKVKREGFLKNFSEIIDESQVSNIEAPFFSARGVDLQWVLRVEFKGVENMDKLADVFNSHMSTLYAERVPNHYLSYTPNDLGANSSNNQWHLYKIQAQQAWDISKGSRTVKVAIVDDAVLVTHPDLVANIWVNPKEIPNNGIDDDKNGYIDDVNGYDVGGNDNDPNPNTSSFMHGTHCAGITGSTTDNGVGIASIGFNISLIPVKSTLTGQSSTTLIPRGYEGITYAVAAGADIISCSWGGGSSSQTGTQVVQYAISKGCIVVAAMGNDNRNMRQYPASYTGVVSVAATGGSNDVRASYSNYHSTTTISAPGSFIRSTVTNNTYQSQSGTSMATPLVSGLLALMKSHMPSITNTELIDILKSSADNIDAQNPSFIGMLGAGRINAYKALQAVEQLKQNSAPNISFEIEKTSFCPGETVRFKASSNAGPITSYFWEFPGGTPSTSTDAEPEISYSGTGNRSVYLTVQNSVGSDKDSLMNEISFSTQGIGEVVYSNFESGTVGPLWTVTNQNATYGFNVSNLIVSGDTNRVLKLSAYGSSVGYTSAITSQEIDFSNLGNGILTFDYAYAPRSASANDSLFVELSLDQGNTFITLVAKALSKELATAPVTGSAFTPSNDFQWCALQGKCIQVDLKKYNRANSVVIRIRHKGVSNGNNLYIDNFRIEGNCAGLVTSAPIASTSTTNKVECGAVTVDFVDNSTNFPATFHWYFPGGSPSESFEPNVSVSYSQVGNYPVYLVVESIHGRDSVMWNNKVSIRSLPNITATATDTVFCRGGSTTLSGDGGVTYTWSPLVALSASTGKTVTASPNSTTTYFVEGTDAFGCKNTASVHIDVKEGPISPLIFRSGERLYIPSQSNASYQWYRNGSPISGAESFEYNMTASGTYEVLITNTNTGCSTWSREPFTYIFTGINNPSEANNTLYPNPTQDVLNIQSAHVIGQYRIMGVDGKVVLAGSSDLNTIQLDVSDFVPGIYVVEWSGIRMKFVVEH